MTVFPPIETLLAHRDNMLLLADVVAMSDTEVICQAIPDGSAWYAHGDAGDFPMWVAIELMAQSIACHVALIALRSGRGPRPGVLLGTRNYKAARTFVPHGAVLTIRATESCRAADGLAAYDCVVRSADGEELATAALTVFEPADLEQFILGTDA